MKKYILIQKSTDGNPLIARNTGGQVKWFSTKTEAERFTMEQKITEYEIFKLEQGKKPD